MADAAEVTEVKEKPSLYGFGAAIGSTKFEPGTVVQLHSGAHLFTVVSSGAGQVRVTWFDGAKFGDEWLREECLRKFGG